jgi:hypothetical protein
MKPLPLWVNLVFAGLYAMMFTGLWKVSEDLQELKSRLGSGPLADEVQLMLGRIMFRRIVGLVIGVVFVILCGLKVHMNWLALGIFSIAWLNTINLLGTARELAGRPATKVRAPTPPTAHIVISNLRPDASHEQLTVENRGIVQQDLTGWEIRSLIGGQTFVFPEGTTVDMGASIRVHSGHSAYSSRPTDLFWKKRYIWKNSGDIAQLYNAEGDLIHEYRFGDQE